MKSGSVSQGDGEAAGAPDKIVAHGVQKWVAAFHADFARRLLAVLPGAFRTLEPATVLSLLQAKLSFPNAESEAAVERGVAVARVDGSPIDAHDLARLQARAVVSACHAMRRAPTWEADEVSHGCHAESEVGGQWQAGAPSGWNATMTQERCAHDSRDAEGKGCFLGLTTAPTAASLRTFGAVCITLAQGPRAARATVAPGRASVHVPRAAIEPLPSCGLAACDLRPAACAPVRSSGLAGLRLCGDASAQVCDCAGA